MLARPFPPALCSRICVHHHFCIPASSDGCVLLCQTIVSAAQGTKSARGEENMKISPFIGSRQVFSLVILLLSSCTGIDGWQEEIVIPVHKIHSNNTQNPPSTTITELFSRQWAENYATDRSVHVAGGCSLGEANYTWRRFGFGTNINSKFTMLHCAYYPCIV